MAGGMGTIAVASGTRQATTLLQFSQMRGDWVSSMKGEGGSGLELLRELSLRSTPLATRPTRPQTVMKNVNEGKGVFAPLVVLTRSIVGTKRFNQLRGKGIALHSQVSILPPTMAPLSWSPCFCSQLISSCLSFSFCFLSQKNVRT